MKVIMVAICSINGKIIRGSNPNIYTWTSKEDQKLFFSKISNSKLIVMGSSTYEAHRRQMKHKKGRLRIVLTSHPEKYESEQIDGKIEFTSETPRQLINRLINYKEMLVVGGSKIYSAFMKERLIDEIYLTIEPIVFGKGKNLFAEGDFDADLKLVSSKKLNKNGTILLEYTIIKETPYKCL